MQSGAAGPERSRDKLTTTSHTRVTVCVCDSETIHEGVGRTAPKVCLCLGYHPVIRLLCCGPSGDPSALRIKSRIHPLSNPGVPNLFPPVCPL